MYDFGLTDEQFWGLTPAKFNALSERHEQSTRQADLRAGIVASVIANVNRDEKTRPEPYTPNDFVPRYEDPEEEKPVAKPSVAPAMTPEQILRHMKAAFPKKPKKPAEAHGG